MSLLSLRNVEFTWSGEVLLDRLNLEIQGGERIGLLGRNGAGKSTLMKIMAGEVQPDDGEVKLAHGVRIGRLIQEVPSGTEHTVNELVAQGWDGESHPAHDWEAQQAVDRILGRMGLSGEQKFATLSSGMKRRALLAQALIQHPDILLLDEPTNHLDIDSITWLEDFLQQYEGTLIFVTHDRAFLQNLADRILEVDRGNLFDWTCDYKTFLNRKQQALEAEEKQNALFDKKLAEEEVWIRQGVKARRTRNEGRVRALKKMREERAQRRAQVGNVKMQASTAERSGQLVAEAKGVGFTYGDREIFQNFSTVINRGDRIGVIGPNGAGKSTLLKVLLGQMPPTSGSLRNGTNLKVIYFDQLREQIAEDKTIVENVGEGQEMIEINGARKHIYGYLQDFLFTPVRARRQARFLSGGERNRMMLAKIFKQPSNVMVLDEPTNDLDSETLELLEELIDSYQGTVIIVSHDRQFLNNLVTSTFVLEGDGTVREYDGGYDDYVRQKGEQSKQVKSTVAQKSLPEVAGSKPASTKSAEASSQNQVAPAVKSVGVGPKLSYKEQKELEKIPQQIEKFELELGEIQQLMADPQFYKAGGDELTVKMTRLQDLEESLLKAYSRWDELAARDSQ